LYLRNNHCRPLRWCHQVYLCTCPWPYLGSWVEQRFAVIMRIFLGVLLLMFRWIQVRIRRGLCTQSDLIAFQCHPYHLGTHLIHSPDLPLPLLNAVCQSLTYSLLFSTAICYAVFWGDICHFASLLLLYRSFLSLSDGLPWLVEKVSVILSNRHSFVDLFPALSIISTGFSPRIY
jgi:hypothetical protein